MQTHDSRPVAAKATSRRIFLKGAVIAACTPAIAVAPLLPYTLDSLAADYDQITAAYNNLFNASEELWDSDGGPPVPSIQRSELPHPYSFNMRSREIISRSALLELFAYEDRLTVLNHEQLGMPEAVVKSRYAHNETARQKYLAIWDERESAFQRWRKESGYADMQRRMDELADLQDAADERVLKYSCQSVEDVRQKLAHVAKAYPVAAADDTFSKLLASIAA